MKNIVIRSLFLIIYLFCFVTKSYSAVIEEGALYLKANYGILNYTEKLTTSLNSNMADSYGLKAHIVNVGIGKAISRDISVDLLFSHLKPFGVVDKNIPLISFSSIGLGFNMSFPSNSVLIPFMSIRATFPCFYFDSSNYAYDVNLNSLNVNFQFVSGILINITRNYFLNIEFFYSPSVGDTIINTLHKKYYGSDGWGAMTGLLFKF